MAAEPDVMREYAGLVEDTALRDRFLTTILEEYARTRSAIEEIFGGPLSVPRPRVAAVMADERRVRLLHGQQVALLRSWRASKPSDDAPADALLIDLLVTVNAIASGLGATG